MAIPYIQLNSVGVILIVTIIDQDKLPIDLSDASIIDFKLQRPDGTTFSRNAGFVSDGSDGKIQYTTASGDISDIGIWRYQAYVAVGSSLLYSTINKFRVVKNIKT